MAAPLRNSLLLSVVHITIKSGREWKLCPDSALEARNSFSKRCISASDAAVSVRRNRGGAYRKEKTQTIVKLLCDTTQICETWSRIMSRFAIFFSFSCAFANKRRTYPLIKFIFSVKEKVCSDGSRHEFLKIQRRAHAWNSAMRTTHAAKPPPHKHDQRKHS